jgi:ABC-2 type transport system ATP-binding protein
MIKAHGLSKIHDHAALLANVDLEVGRGKTFGLTGLNGSGRTTLLSILATLVKPTSGSLEMDGIDALKSPHLARPFIGYVSESPSFVDHLTVGEYLEFLSACRKSRSGIGPSATLSEETFGSFPRASPIRSLSRGLKQQLAWAAALMHAPRLLLLDEPMSHLDPLAGARCESALKNVRREGGTVVIASNHIADLQNLCDEVGFMHQGRLLKVVKLEGRDLNLADVLHDLIDQQLGSDSRVVPASSAAASRRDLP